MKRYGIIFTCLAIRAIHSEVAFSLDNYFFLLALRRFIATRGQVEEIRSDNGINFTSGENELRECISAWNQEKIHEELMQRNIKWTFNPPYGSHFRGIWERCIRTTRKILRVLPQEQAIDDVGLANFMCEVESIMNGRPITTVSSDQQDPEPLMPNAVLCSFNALRPVSKRGFIIKSQMETGATPCRYLLKKMVQRVSSFTPKQVEVARSEKKFICRAGFCGEFTSKIGGFLEESSTFVLTRKGLMQRVLVKSRQMQSNPF